MEEQMKALLGADRVSIDSADIADHSYDAWPVAVKVAGPEQGTPGSDVVVRPHTVEEVSLLCQWASSSVTPLTARGIGSAVTGAPLAAGGNALDLSSPDHTIEINTTNATVRSEAGKIGHLLEEEVNQHGFTLNHSPQSLYHSTIGYWRLGRDPVERSVFKPLE